MEWLVWAVVVVVLGLAAVAGSGRFGAMPPPVRDTPAPQLPPGELAADDLQRVQFAVVTRGYSMTQVDELLDRLANQLAGRVRGATAPTISPGSAIMGVDQSRADVREGEHGSNEAPHG